MASSHPLCVVNTLRRLPVCCEREHLHRVSCRSKVKEQSARSEFCYQPLNPDVFEVLLPLTVGSLFVCFDPNKARFGVDGLHYQFYRFQEYLRTEGGCVKIL